VSTASGARPASAGVVARTVSSLRSRNFRLFFIGQTISNTGNWLTMVALTLLVLHRTGSGTAVGLLAACQFGPMLVLSPWAGVLVDRTDKRRLLVVTQLLEMGQSVALAALALLPAAPLGAFYATAFAGGCMLAFDNPVRRAFVNEMVPLEDVPNAVTVYTAMVNLSRVAGPAAAGALVVSVGYSWTFALDAVSYLSVLLALALMRPSELRRVEAAPRERGQIREAIRYVRSMPELWISFAMVGIVGTLSYNFPVVLPLLVETALGGDDAAYTLAYSVFSLGSLVGAFAVARRTTVTIRTVSVGAAWLGVSMLGLAVVPSVAAAVAAAAVVGMGAVAFLTAATAIAQVQTEQRMIGRVLGLQIVLVVGTTPIGGPLLGALSDAAGARAPVVAGAVGALAAAAVGVVAARRTGIAR
jgi:MFS family permease